MENHPCTSVKETSSPCSVWWPQQSILREPGISDGTKSHRYILWVKGTWAPSRGGSEELAYNELC